MVCSVERYNGNKEDGKNEGKQIKRLGRFAIKNTHRDPQNQKVSPEETDKKQKAASVRPSISKPIDKLVNQNVFHIEEGVTTHKAPEPESKNGTDTKILDEKHEENQNKIVKREIIKSTPRKVEFLPDFGYQKNLERYKKKKLNSESDRPNSNDVSDKVVFSDRAIRSISKRSSFEISLPKKCSAKKKSNYLVLSSSNSSRSRSKSKKRL